MLQPTNQRIVIVPLVPSGSAQKGYAGFAAPKGESGFIEGTIVAFDPSINEENDKFSKVADGMRVLVTRAGATIHWDPDYGGECYVCRWSYIESIVLVPTVVTTTVAADEPIV